MRVTIKDDFDLDKIIESGQCFRPKFCEEIGKYRFICRDKVLYINKMDKNFDYEVSCDENDWNLFWKDYFDLNRNYSNIRNELRDEYFVNAAVFSEGIRIIKQDYWETLISYIISQRKSIPAIKSSVEKLCDLFGEEIETDYEKVSLFPSPEQLKNADEEILSSCGLGYRVPYILGVIDEALNERLPLTEWEKLSNEELFEKLCFLKGVGTKVANCVMLFAYHRTDRAPVDVWIKRVIDNEFNGINRFDDYGNDAGIVQQYVFYYVRKNGK